MIISEAPSLCILFIFWLLGDGVYAIERVSPDVCGLVRAINRLDCFPEEGSNKQKCEERGCCWVPQDSSEPGMPWCFFPPEYATYRTKELNRTDRGFSALLWRNQSSYVANEFKQVRLDAIAETKTRLRLRFTIPSDPNRWEPPIPLGEPEKNLIKGDYNVDVQQSPFGIRRNVCSMEYNWVRSIRSPESQRDRSRPQDPATWSTNATAAIRAALRTRYHLLPYIYSLFFRAHLNGTTVARALAFEFPDELVTYKIKTQFMLGSCLLVNPVLDEGRTYVEAYVPTGEWVDLSNGARIVSVGQAKNFEAPLHVIPVLVRGGCILPLQSTPNITSVSRKDGLSLLVVLSTVDDGDEADSQASGELFWDDGVSEPLSFIHTQFEVKNRVLTLRSSMSHPDTLKKINLRETMLKRILLVGLLQSPESVTMDHEELEFRFLKSLQVVVIDLPEGTTVARDAQIRWSFYP
ncbi:Lysosomal alpha-glucosidase [Fasciola gigantica]|uniref:Lysosomal alpha-glucosidase n=1 Tax=Fasciola gigantica TaxID=46835 RepID=A0A504Y9I5_FASGI|nr:Lysosomal alpha-glucosidase [Fasciola gigantica]